MALINCPECKREISDQAIACPNCAYPLKPQSPAPVQQTAKTEAPRKKKSYVLRLVVGIFVFAILANLLENKKTSTSTSTSNGSPSSVSPAKLKLTVQQLEYDNGYMKVVGVAENIGEEAAFSPTIVLEVHNQAGNVLLANDNAWPTGALFKYMQKGEAAAFQFFTSIPGSPQHIIWRIFAKDYSFEVVRKDKSDGR